MYVSKIFVRMRDHEGTGLKSPRRLLLTKEDNKVELKEEFSYLRITANVRTKY